MALRMAWAGKPHNIGKTSLVPAATEASAAKLNAILMSNNTIKRCISDMASDVKEQVLDGIRKSPFG